MEYITWIFVNLLGFLICGALLGGIASANADKFIEKIPTFLRWLLTPIYGFICLAICEAVLRFFTMGMSIFWGSSDTESNIFITGYTLIPMLGMYGLCWGSYLMAPRFKDHVVIFFGAGYLMFNLFVFVMSDFSLASDSMVERITQSRDASTFSSIIAIIFYSLGLWMGFKSAKGNSFFSFP